LEEKDLSFSWRGDDGFLWELRQGLPTIFWMEVFGGGFMQPFYKL